jgi:hypothetical protein
VFEGFAQDLGNLLVDPGRGLLQDLVRQILGREAGVGVGADPEQENGGAEEAKLDSQDGIAKRETHGMASSSGEG